MKVYFGLNPAPVDSQRKWRDFCTYPPQLIACDTETVSLKDQTIVGLAIAYTPTDSIYWSADDPDIEVAYRLLSDPSVRKVFHNAAFDLRVLRPYHSSANNVDDTAIIRRLQRKLVPLDEVGPDYGIPVEQAKAFMARLHIQTMDKAPFMEIAPKCAKDALTTYRIFADPSNQEVLPYYQRFERPLLPWLDHMSSMGIALDQTVRQKLERFYSVEELYYRTVALNMGFNISSPFEVGFMLAKRGNFLPFTKSKRQLATDEQTLSRVNDPLAEMVLLWRQASKLLSTYLIPTRNLTRVYTTLSADAITGRLASSRMNLHNIPKAADQEMNKLRGVPTVRSMFLPDSGLWTSADASQIELRVLAYLSQDKHMLEVFRSGGDIHLATEQAVWGTAGVNRLAAKVFNFAMVYLATASTIAGHLHTRDVRRIASLMQQWMQAYPGVARWLQEIQEFGLRYGYVETLYGRKMALPWEYGEKHMRSAAVNYVVQGTAAEVFKLIMLELARPEQRLQIHDELLFDGRQDIPADIADLTPVHTPLKVGYGTYWGEWE